MEMHPPPGVATAVLAHYVDGHWIDADPHAALKVIASSAALAASLTSASFLANESSR